MNLDIFKTKACRIGVIGLGYVGLPLIRSFCRAGLTTTGFDIDPAKIDLLRSGKCYLKHIPAEQIAPFVRSGKFIPTADFALLREQNAIIICVPTPLTHTKTPDMSFIENTAKAIRDHLVPGQLIVLESTTYPGTTRQVVAKILGETGLVAGRDYLLAFSPEREDPGRTDIQTHAIPKVVGGVNEASLAAAMATYGHAMEKLVPVSSCEVAESAKLLENIYRCVNIAMVNELKVLFDKMGIDVWEVIEAAKTKPFGFQAFYPGPGLGGHCIPVDPYYLSWKAREYDVITRFIELAGEVNSGMPAYVVGRVMDALNGQKKSLNGAKVLLLGLAYKADIDDVRESPSVVIYEMLAEKGAIVSYNDPFIPQTHRQRQHDLRAQSVEITDSLLAEQDCVIICTAHSCYNWEQIVGNSKLVVDTRNATAKVKAPVGKVMKA